MRNEEKGSPILPVMAYGGVSLVVIGTIAGMFNTRSFGAVLGTLVAIYVMWIITTMVMYSMFPKWSVTKQGIVGLIIAIIIVLNLFWIGFSK